MKAKTIDGKLVDWNPHLQKNNKQEENKSKGHKAAIILLKELYPTCKILEEVSIPIQTGEWSYIDIYLPLLKLAIEINGVQHDKFSPFFHNDRRDFLYGQLKDKKKKEWCDINNIKLIILSTKDQDEWKKILLSHN